MSLSSQPRRLWLAYLSGAFGLAVTAQINFLVPLRARELGASFDVIGLIVGAGAAAPALLSLLTGATIDRFGARRTFVLGTAATAVLAALSVLVTGYWWFLVLQPLLGVARNLGWLASQTYVTGIGTEQQRHGIAGRFAFFTSTGQMAAPALIGAAAQLAGFRWAFLFLAGYAGAFAVIGLLLAPAPLADAPSRTETAGLGLRSGIELLALRPIQVVLLLSGLRLWITWIYTAFVPIYLVSNGLSAGTVGVVMATAGVVAALIAPTTGAWMRFASPATVATVGLGGGAVALMLAPYLVTVPIVFVVPALIGAGQGLSLPVILTIVAAAAPEGKRGVALGLRATVNQSLAAAGPMLVGALISASGVILGFTIGAVVAAGMVATAQYLHVTASRGR